MRIFWISTDIVEEKSPGARSIILEGPRAQSGLLACGSPPSPREYTLRHLPIGPAVIAPARAGSKRKFMKVIQSSLDQAQVPHARSRVHDHEFFRMLKDRPKDVGIIGVQRLPTAHLLPIVARTENSALPFKRQLWTKYLIPRGRERPTTDRAAWTYCRARLNRASLA